jgi:hypothetical protein
MSHPTQFTTASGSRRVPLLLAATILGLGLTIPIHAVGECGGSGACMNGVPWNTQSSWTGWSLQGGQCIRTAYGCNSSCQTYTATQYAPLTSSGNCAWPNITAPPGPSGPVAPGQPPVQASFMQPAASFQPAATSTPVGK